MKKLTILLFSILISFSSYGGFFTDLFDDIFSSSTTNKGWSKVNTYSSGNTVYIDKNSISERNNGYVYFWELTDNLKPFWGTMCSVMYIEGDCVAKRYKFLKNMQYTESMCSGNPKVNYTYDGSMGWSYSDYPALNYVCDYVD